MKYFAIILRIAIIVIIAIGVHMMILSGFEAKTPLMCGGVSVLGLDYI